MSQGSKIHPDDRRRIREWMRERPRRMSAREISQEIDCAERTVFRIAKEAADDDATSLSKHEQGDVAGRQPV